jgi:WD40 repeat protein
VLAVGAMDHQIVAWHPDGQRLAVAGSDPRIQIWNVADRRKVAILEGHTALVPDLAFHPNGKLLASHSWEGRLLLWEPSSGRQLLGLTTVGVPQFSADGCWLRLTWGGNQSELLEVAANREYRTLVSSAGVNRGGYDFGDISPDGRLLAVGLDDGARLWDLESGRELVKLPADTPYVFFDTQKIASEAGANAPPGLPWCLLTSGSEGLRRWPLLTEGSEGNGLRLGTPKQLSRLGRARFGRTPDGRTLVAATQEGGTNQLLDPATGKVRELGAHPDGEIRALSGDGRFAASCGWHSDRVRLWDAATGRLIHEWVLGKRMLVFFTPDSRVLVICRGEDFSFWDVETLQPLRRITREQNQFPGWVAFSPDARLMALEMAPGVIHLMDAASGRTVARLTDPDGDRAWWQAFTPDGTRLVTVARFASAVHIWDLRALRTRLKTMNLDWDWPEFPPGPAGVIGQQRHS